MRRRACAGARASIDSLFFHLKAVLHWLSATKLLETSGMLCELSQVFVLDARHSLKQVLPNPLCRLLVLPTCVLGSAQIGKPGSETLRPRALLTLLALPRLLHHTCYVVS